MTAKVPVTAFDKGQAAARDGRSDDNPFTEGSVEANNFALGYRFAMQRRRVSFVDRASDAR